MSKPFHDDFYRADGGQIFMLIVLVLLLVFLTGCGMSNDEIIAEAKKCHDAGLKTYIVLNGVTFETSRVICTTQDDMP